jgi:hypothetical protein
MLTLEVLLSLIDGQPSDAFDAPLAAEAGRIAGGLPPTATTRVVHSLQHHREAARRAGDPLGRLDELLASGLPPAHTRVPVTSFDAVLEVSVPDGTDPARSAAVLGVDHTIIEGSGALQLFYCLRRVPALTHEQFSAYWLNQLVEHTTKTPGKSAYRQLHADPDLTLRASKAAGVAIDDVDGVALEWYPDMASFWSAVGWANEPDAGVIQAETQMSDFSRALSILGYGPDGLG